MYVYVYFFGTIKTTNLMQRPIIGYLDKLVISVCLC